MILYGSATQCACWGNSSQVFILILPLIASLIRKYFYLLKRYRPRLRLFCFPQEHNIGDSLAYFVRLHQTNMDICRTINMKLNCLTIGIRQKHIELRPNISFIQKIIFQKKLFSIERARADVCQGFINIVNLLLHLMALLKGGNGSKLWYSSWTNKKYISSSSNILVQKKNDPNQIVSEIVL